MRQRNYNFAKSDYERLLKLVPQSYNGRLGLATLEQKDGKYEAALSILNAMIAEDVYKRQALKNRLSILGVQLDQEKLDKVYEEFLKLADKKKDINDDDILVCLLYTSNVVTS